jgi:hypothetical protein
LPNKAISLELTFDITEGVKLIGTFPPGPILLFSSKYGLKVLAVPDPPVADVVMVCGDTPQDVAVTVIAFKVLLKIKYVVPDVIPPNELVN